MEKEGYVRKSLSRKEVVKFIGIIGAIPLVSACEKILNPDQLFPKDTYLPTSTKTLYPSATKTKTYTSSPTKTREPTSTATVEATPTPENAQDTSEQLAARVKIFLEKSGDFSDDNLYNNLYILYGQKKDFPLGIVEESYNDVLIQEEL